MIGSSQKPSLATHNESLSLLSLLAKPSPHTDLRPQRTKTPPPKQSLKDQKIQPQSPFDVNRTTDCVLSFYFFIRLYPFYGSTPKTQSFRTTDLNISQVGTLLAQGRLSRQTGGRCCVSRLSDGLSRIRLCREVEFCRRKDSSQTSALSCCI